MAVVIMGHRDLTKLHKIYKVVNQIIKENGLPFQFKIDDGDFETAIEIFDDGRVNHPPRQSRSPYNESGEIFCPDLLDFHNKIILEYEEEAKPNKGAKRRKGHFEGNNRDKNRDLHYGKAKFRFLKIWESDKDWIAHLSEFLKTCNKESTT